MRAENLIKEFKEKKSKEKRVNSEIVNSESLADLNDTKPLAGFEKVKIHSINNKENEIRSVYKINN